MSTANNNNIIRLLEDRHAVRFKRGQTSAGQPCMQACGIAYTKARKIMNDADRHGLTSWAGWRQDDTLNLTVMLSDEMHELRTTIDAHDRIIAGKHTLADLARVGITNTTTSLQEYKGA